MNNNLIDDPFLDKENTFSRERKRSGGAEEINRQEISLGLAENLGSGGTPLAYTGAKNPEFASHPHSKFQFYQMNQRNQSIKVCSLLLPHDLKIQPKRQQGSIHIQQELR